MSSKSPNRKPLVKKIISYYDTLHKSRPGSRSNSRSPIHTHSSNFTQMKTHKKAKAQITPSPNQMNTGPNHHHSHSQKLKKSCTNKENLKESFYNEKKVRGKNLRELKTLMKQELYKVQVEAESPDCTLDCLLDGEITHMLEDRVGEEQAKRVSHKARLEKIKRKNSAKLKERYDREISLNNIPLRENLLPLNINKNYILENKTECRNYDYHQRKVKEIRRLQYAVTVQELSSKKRRRSISRSTEQFSVLVSQDEPLESGERKIGKSQKGNKSQKVQKTVKKAVIDCEYSEQTINPDNQDKMAPKNKWSMKKNRKIQKLHQLCEDGEKKSPDFHFQKELDQSRSSYELINDLEDFGRIKVRKKTPQKKNQAKTGNYEDSLLQNQNQNQNRARRRVRRRKDQRRANSKVATSSKNSTSRVRNKSQSKKIIFRKKEKDSRVLSVLTRPIIQPKSDFHNNHGAQSLSKEAAQSSDLKLPIMKVENENKTIQGRNWNQFSKFRNEGRILALGTGNVALKALNESNESEIDQPQKTEIAKRNEPLEQKNSEHSESYKELIDEYADDTPLKSRNSIVSHQQAVLESYIQECEEVHPYSSQNFEKSERGSVSLDKEREDNGNKELQEEVKELKEDRILEEEEKEVFEEEQVLSEEDKMLQVEVKEFKEEEKEEFEEEKELYRDQTLKSQMSQEEVFLEENDSERTHKTHGSEEHSGISHLESQNSPKHSNYIHSSKSESSKIKNSSEKENPKQGAFNHENGIETSEKLTEKEISEESPIETIYDDSSHPNDTLNNPSNEQKKKKMQKLSTFKTEEPTFSSSITQSPPVSQYNLSHTQAKSDLNLKISSPESSFQYCTTENSTEDLKDNLQEKYPQTTQIDDQYKSNEQKIQKKMKNNHIESPIDRLNKVISKMKETVNSHFKSAKSASSDFKSLTTFRTIISELPPDGFKSQLSSQKSSGKERNPPRQGGIGASKSNKSNKSINLVKSKQGNISEHLGSNRKEKIDEIPKVETGEQEEDEEYGEGEEQTTIHFESEGVNEVISSTEICSHQREETVKESKCEVFYKKESSKYRSKNWQNRKQLKNLGYQIETFSQDAESLTHKNEQEDQAHKNKDKNSPMLLKQQIIKPQSSYNKKENSTDSPEKLRNNPKIEEEKVLYNSDTKYFSTKEDFATVNLKPQAKRCNMFNCEVEEDFYFDNFKRNFQKNDENEKNSLGKLEEIDLVLSNEAIASSDDYLTMRSRDQELLLDPINLEPRSLKRLPNFTKKKNDVLEQLKISQDENDEKNEFLEEKKTDVPQNLEGNINLKINDMDQSQKPDTRIINATDRMRETDLEILRLEEELGRMKKQLLPSSDSNSRQKITQNEGKYIETDLLKDEPTFGGLSKGDSLEELDFTLIKESRFETTSNGNYCTGGGYESLQRTQTVNEQAVTHLLFETNPNLENITDKKTENRKSGKNVEEPFCRTLQQARKEKKLRMALQKENLDKFIQNVDLEIDSHFQKSNRFSNNGSNLLIPLKNSEIILHSIKKEMHTLKSISRHLEDHSGRKNSKSRENKEKPLSKQPKKKLFGAEITIDTNVYRKSKDKIVNAASNLGTPRDKVIDLEKIMASQGKVPTPLDSDRFSRVEERIRRRSRSPHQVRIKGPRSISRSRKSYSESVGTLENDETIDKMQNEKLITSESESQSPMALSLPPSIQYTGFTDRLAQSLSQNSQSIPSMQNCKNEEEFMKGSAVNLEVIRQLRELEHKSAVRIQKFIRAKLNPPKPTPPKEPKDQINLKGFMAFVKTLPKTVSEEKARKLYKLMIEQLGAQRNSRIHQKIVQEFIFKKKKV